jgi:zinc transport system permease protein
MREYHGFSLLFGLFSGIIGLVVSYFTNVATGPMIVIVASVVYFATYVYGKEK